MISLMGFQFISITDFVLSIRFNEPQDNRITKFFYIKASAGISVNYITDFKDYIVCPGLFLFIFILD